MILPAKPIFDRFGSLQTWIVGIQYYEARARSAEFDDVYFDREPDNPFDPHAIAVFTKNGEQIGHLPRYDARYFAPLIDAGAIALIGRTTGPEKNGRIPLRVDVHATEKVSPILAHDSSDDWRAIYHNLLVSLWSQLHTYSAETLAAFRNRLRDLAHSENLFPKTEFLYRMMKAAIETRALAQQESDKEYALQFFRAVVLDMPRGWPEFSVHTVGLDAHASPMLPLPSPASTALEKSDQSLLLSSIASRCAYPSGAQGILILVHNRFHSLQWFADPACAQVVWFSSILDALQYVNEEDESERAALSPEAIKAALVEQIERADFKREHGHAPDAFTIRFTGDGHYGALRYDNGRLIHAEYQVIPPVECARAR